LRLIDEGGKGAFPGVGPPRRGSDSSIKGCQWERATRQKTTAAGMTAQRKVASRNVDRTARKQREERDGKSAKERLEKKKVTRKRTESGVSPV